MKLSKQKIQSKQKENLQTHRASGHEWLYTEKKNETKNKKRERTRLKRKKQLHHTNLSAAGVRNYESRDNYIC